MGTHSFTFIIFGLFGAAIVFGVPWLMGKILPFVGPPAWGSTTAWVLGGVGLFGGYIVAQISITGWRETWRSWAMWALFMVALMGLGALAGIVMLYSLANPGQLETIVELGEKVSIDQDNLVPILFVGVPILLFVIMAVLGIWKASRIGKSRR